MVDHPIPDIEDELVPIRPRPNLVRKEPFVQHVKLVIPNITCIRSETAGLINTDLFNPNINIVELEDLEDAVGRRRMNTCIILIILSISPVANQAANFRYDKSKKGSNSTINRQNRRLVVMCPFSKPNSNTAMILLGPGMCKQFWNNDPSFGDNGSICKYFIILILYILFQFINVSLFLVYRSRLDDYVNKYTKY